MQEVLDRGFKEGKRHDQISLKVLSNPLDASFPEVYALEDLPKEDLIEAITYRVKSRQVACIGTFVAYHVVKNILWNRGIGTRFFYYTRFMSFPALFLGFGYFCVRKT